MPAVNCLLSKLAATLLNDPRYAPLAALPRETDLPILRADPAYLTFAFDEIEALQKALL